ncbi:hypothetical protein [Massilia sp. DWR3-1-1]|uniref:hypothetical protein n=1 Tax=Massilia sp. DWR3-1-1 TaxID=2804559 RepID=UPI003CE8DFE5
MSHSPHIPMHRPFSWLPYRLEDSSDARFAAMVKTVARGAQTIATIVQKDLIHASAGVQPLLSVDDLDGLVGLMVSSLNLMTGAAEDRIDYLEAEALKGAKK